MVLLSFKELSRDIIELYKIAVKLRETWKESV